VAFGQKIVGTTSAKTLTIANTGDELLEGTLAITGDGALSISATDLSVSGGASADVTVTFAPATVGTYAATITITSNDADEPEVSVAVTGAGVEEITGPGVIGATIVKARMTFDTTIDVTDQTAVDTFVGQLKQILADLLGISIGRISVISVTEGSVVVDYKITNTGGAEGEPTAAAALTSLQAAVDDQTTDEFADLAPLTSLADQSETVSLVPEDVNCDAILGCFSRGPSATVGFTDFFAFADVFGASVGDLLYDAKYDISSATPNEADGTIDFFDFFRFADDFGKTVANADEIIAALE
jgi:hypothetical protein